jgi:hypothetical protein
LKERREQTLSESSRASLDSQPWWTDADKAELRLFVKEFVDVAWEHKGCRACKPDWCAVVRESFDSLLSWRHARILVSKAEYLRVQQLRRRTHEHHNN